MAGSLGVLSNVLQTAISLAREPGASGWAQAVLSAWL